MLTPIAGRPQRGPGGTAGPLLSGPGRSPYRQYAPTRPPLTGRLTRINSELFVGPCRKRKVSPERDLPPTSSPGRGARRHAQGRCRSVQVGSYRVRARSRYGRARSRSFLAGSPPGRLHLRSARACSERGPARCRSGSVLYCCGPACCRCRLVTLESGWTPFRCARATSRSDQVRSRNAPERSRPGWRCFHCEPERSWRARCASCSYWRACRSFGAALSSSCLSGPGMARSCRRGPDGLEEHSARQ